MKKSINFNKLIVFMFLVCFITMFIKADVFAAKKPEFTVTYLYGSKNMQQTVIRGENAIAPKDVLVPGYTFIGWSDSGKNIQSDKIILGMYTNNTMYKSATNASTKSKKINDKISAPGKFWWDLSIKGVPYETCVVRWYNSKNGDIWKTEVVPYGTTLPDPPDPTMNGYEFAGWEGSWYNITEDRNIAAYFTVVEESQDLTIQSIEEETEVIPTEDANVTVSNNVSESSDSNDNALEVVQNNDDVNNQQEVKPLNEINNNQSTDNNTSKSTFTSKIKRLFNK